MEAKEFDKLELVKQAIIGAASHVVASLVTKAIREKDYTRAAALTAGLVAFGKAIDKLFDELKENNKTV